MATGVDIKGLVIKEFKCSCGVKFMAAADLPHSLCAACYIASVTHTAGNEVYLEIADEFDVDYIITYGDDVDYE